MSSNIRCTCCQAEITAPQFYNGFPYGYTCIKKVDPQYKRTKVQYIAMDSFKVLQGEGTQRQVVHLSWSGNKKSIVIYADVKGTLQGAYIQDGVMFVAETKL